MYEKNFLNALKFTLGIEAGYSNDKDDMGGKTYRGVTQNTYDNYCRQNGIHSKDVRDLSEKEITEFYYKGFWQESGADKIKSSIKSAVVFDTAVLASPQTAKAIYRKSGGNMNKYLDLREDFHKNIVRQYPTQKKFEKGWLNRVNSLRNIVKEYDKTQNILVKKFYPEKQYSVKNSLYRQEFLKDFGKDMFVDELLDSKNINSLELQKIKQAKFGLYDEIVYQSMLKNSSEKKGEKEPVKLTVEMLKNQLAKQNEAKNNFLNKIYMESEGINKRFTGKIPDDYLNPELENNKIFTKEEIDKMSWSETKKYNRAIRYQKKTIGIPTKQQAAKAASQTGSGLVHVTGYVTASGRRVDDYYRARPVK